MIRHLAFTACLLAAVWATAKELEAGAAMPMADRKMPATSGKDVSLADIAGKQGTVVAFWCNHCPYVIKWRERFVALANDFQKQGIGFIAVNSNDPKKVPGDNMAAMKKDAEAHDYTFAYVQDEGSKLAKACGAERTPHIYVFNGEGKLVYVGAIDDSADPALVEKTYLRDVLAALVAGKESPHRHSRAFGCTIKWYK